jgi:LDH2 family malate/lactate/ureidoglycolate dehydrogenase
MAFSLSEAIVHPWGGRRAMLGSNPLAIGIPAQPGPFVVDLATSVVSMGKIHDYAHRGQPLEPGWALDAEGNPTTNPQAARAGALTPFGGAKGYALGLTIELLVAGLTGSAIGTEVAGTLDVDLAPNKGDLLLVIDPRRVGAHDVAERISPYLDAIRNCTPVDGVDRVVAPGDRSRASRERRLIDGIPVADAVWKQLTSLHSTAAKRIEE